MAVRPALVRRLAIGGMAATDPRFEPTVQVRYVCITQLCEGLGGQRQAPTGGAGQDRAATRIELRTVVGRCRISVELQHPTRRMDGVGNDATIGSLARFAD